MGGTVVAHMNVYKCNHYGLTNYGGTRQSSIVKAELSLALKAICYIMKNTSYPPQITALHSLKF